MKAADTDKVVFRKVSEAMNRDERYLALSPIPACGRGLWHHLLFGPHITPLPGLSAIGRLAMAEELGWEIEEFDAAFAEVLDQGLARADWKARVVWLPNALKHNPPASPNVVVSWKRYWDRVPDCDLKIDAYETMKPFLKAHGKAFAEAFDKSCAKPSAKTLSPPSRKEPAFGKASPKPSLNQRAESREQGAEGPSHVRDGSQSGEVVELPPRTHAHGRDGAGR